MSARIVLPEGGTWGPSRPKGRPFAIDKLDAHYSPDHHVIASHSCPSGYGQPYVHWRCACGYESPGPWSTASRFDSAWIRSGYRGHEEAERGWQQHLDAYLPRVEWAGMHSFHVAVTLGGLYKATCDCGWRGHAASVTALAAQHGPVLYQATPDLRPALAV